MILLATGDLAFEHFSRDLVVLLPSKGQHFPALKTENSLVDRGCRRGRTLEAVKQSLLGTDCMHAS